MALILILAPWVILTPGRDLTDASAPMSLPDEPSSPPPQTATASSGVVKLFMKIADLGNRLPDPLTLFVLLTGLVILASLIFEGASAQVTQRDGSVVTSVVGSLLSSANIKWMFTSAVDNFVKFPPLGPVLAVMIGIGVAERTGFVSTGLRVLVRGVPTSLLTATIVFASVMSSMVADAGYVVLTPLGAVLFAGMGRHPIAGLAAAYAGVSGGYSANLLITGLDPLLSRLTQSAAMTVDPIYAAQINPTCNYYFMVASVGLITVLGTLVTTRVVEPMLGTWDPARAQGPPPEVDELTSHERGAFFKALGVSVLTALGLAMLVVPEAGPLRDAIKPEQSGLDAYHSFFESVELLILILFIVPGVVFGVLTGRIKNDRDVAAMASEAMAAMGAYIVLAFIAGQFVAFFNHTQLGTVSAVKGAELLRTLGMTGTPLLLSFIVVSGIMNMFVGSASAKWAFMAPIFVPMLMLSGLSPEAAQAGYRVGDSVTNIISPLMPYLPIIIIFAKKYDREAGVGTILSAMLPYSIAFGLGWVMLLIVWLQLGLPLGPGVSALYVPPGGP